MRDKYIQASLFPSSKRCTVCGIVKNLSEFYRRSRARDGRSSQCKACQAKYKQESWYPKNKERQIELGRLRRQRNAEHYRQKQREYVARNREHYQELLRNWYQRNKDDLRSVRREWKLANRDGQRDRDRERYASNPEKYRAKARDKARRRRLDWNSEAAEYAEVLLRDPCSYCGSRDTITLDHIVPLARGGMNSADNLAAACKSCNSSKQDKDLLSFLLSDWFDIR